MNSAYEMMLFSSFSVDHIHDGLLIEYVTSVPATLSLTNSHKQPHPNPLFVGQKHPC